MTESQRERLRLLTQLRRGQEVIALKTYADRFVFPDISLVDWCIECEVRVRQYTIERRWGTFIFYAFTQIPDSDW